MYDLREGMVAMFGPVYTGKLRRKQAGMPRGCKFKIVICEKCLRPVAENWIVRHLKAGCRIGTQLSRIHPAEFVRVPFKCPECEAYPLFVDIEEWEEETGAITECGFFLSCPNEDGEDCETWHRHWQSDWQPTITRVYHWLASNIRVAEQTE